MIVDFPLPQGPRIPIIFVVDDLRITEATAFATLWCDPKKSVVDA
jgi:hypothetical protein